MLTGYLAHVVRAAMPLPAMGSALVPVPMQKAAKPLPLEKHGFFFEGNLDGDYVYTPLHYIGGTDTTGFLTRFNNQLFYNSADQDYLRTKIFLGEDDAPVNESNRYSSDISVHFDPFRKSQDWYAVKAEVPFFPGEAKNAVFQTGSLSSSVSRLLYSGEFYVKRHDLAMGLSFDENQVQTESYEIDVDFEDIAFLFREYLDREIREFEISNSLLSELAEAIGERTYRNWKKMKTELRDDNYVDVFGEREFLGQVWQRTSSEDRFQKEVRKSLIEILYIDDADDLDMAQIRIFRPKDYPYQLLPLTGAILQIAEAKMKLGE